jgi:high affinity Mn2+ porin
MYTEIDQSISFGTFLGCDRIKRPNDKIRIACAINGISKDHMEYLRNGGYGFIIGDGLNPVTNKSNYTKGFGAETIIEAQYNYQYQFLNFSPDIQWIANPGYNVARGPVWVFGLRAHMYI